MYLSSWNSNLLLFGSWVLIRKYYILSCFYLETSGKAQKQRADEIQPSADEIQPSADEIQPRADEICKQNFVVDFFLNKVSTFF